jgi:hypothetical protein
MGKFSMHSLGAYLYLYGLFDQHKFWSKLQL